MIKDFKTFKLLTESTALEQELIEQFDDNYIEDYYEDHHDISIDEILDSSSHYDLMECFDDDKYKEDWIKGYIADYPFSEITEDGLKSYIEKNIDNDKETKIIEIYNRNNYDEDDEDSEKETEYSDNLLNDLDKYELQEVVEDSREEEECIAWVIKGWYSDHDGKDIFNEFNNYDRNDDNYYDYKNSKFIRLETFELYKKISKYIDDNKLKKNYKREYEDFDQKKDSVSEDIANSPELQRYLLEKDTDNVDAIIDLCIANKFKNKNIGNEYDFQEAYINKCLKDEIDENDDEEYKKTVIEDSLEYLYIKFGINDEMAEKYKPYMWKIEAQYKYNL